MAIIRAISGPFGGLYVGNSTATSTRLTQISAMGTKGFHASYALPQDEFCFATGQYEQSGTYKVGLRLSFESDDPQAYNLAMGNPVGTSNVNTAPSSTIFTVFLVDAVNPSSSLLLPKVQTMVNIDLNREKTAPLVFDIVMRFEGPDATFSPAINSMTKWWNYDSVTALQALLGAMSPNI